MNAMLKSTDRPISQTYRLALLDLDGIAAKIRIEGTFLDVEEVVALRRALAAAGAGVERATTTLRAAEAARRRAVLTALDAGWSITKIAELAGLSRQGVYNIRSD